jgi:chromosome segregation ATPase
VSHDTVTALIGATAALAGGFAKGLWDWARNRSSSTATVQTARIEDAAEMRRELWAEVEKLRDRVDLMQIELDTARRDYLGLLAEHTSLKAEHKTLKHEHDTLLIRYADLERRLNNI